MRGNLRSAVRRLRKLVPVDTRNRGEDGQVLVVIPPPEEDGQGRVKPMPPDTRRMTEGDVAWLRARGERVAWIPDVDVRPEPTEGGPYAP